MFLFIVVLPYAYHVKISTFWKYYDYTPNKWIWCENYCKILHMNLLSSISWYIFTHTLAHPHPIQQQPNKQQTIKQNKKPSTICLLNWWLLVNHEIAMSFSLFYFVFFFQHLGLVVVVCAFRAERCTHLM